jgi:hypothetical protein
MGVSGEAVSPPTAGHPTLLQAGHRTGAEEAAGQEAKGRADPAAVRLHVLPGGVPGKVQAGEAKVNIVTCELPDDGFTHDGHHPISHTVEDDGEDSAVSQLLQCRACPVGSAAASVTSDDLVCVPLQENPEVTKVSDMARYAGEAWRAIAPEKRSEYEKMSADNKVGVAAAIAAAVHDTCHADRCRGCIEEPALV